MQHNRATGAQTRTVQEWPFLGRDAELEVLLRSLDPEVAAGARGAVVVAPPGVGKTRLLHETRRMAGELGLPTASVIATDAASRTPYGAVLHLLLGEQVDAGDRAGWHAAFAAALRTDDGRPTVLVIDDAQHLDDGSAALLLHLTLQGVVAPVVSVRSGTRAPEPVTLLWKDGLCLRVDLQPLTAEELSGLIGTVLGARVSERTLTRLAAVCDGNVLFARELVTAAVDGGALRLTDGVWSWDERIVLAPRLLDAVGGRLARLTEEERRALAVVALGEPLPVTVAERVAAASPFASLEEAGLLEVTGPPADGELRLAHPLYGEVVLDQLGRLAHRQLVAALADALEADPDRAEAHVVRVATWRLEAGLPTDWRTLHHAAARANQTFDHRLAARLGRRALDALEAGDSSSRTVVTLELARALVGCNDVEQADTLLGEVEDAVLRSRDEGLVDGYVDVRFWVSYFGLGRRDEVLRLFDRLEDGPDGARHRGRCAAYRACLALGEGRPEAALAEAEPLLESPEVSDMQRLLTLETAGEALASLGRAGAADRVWDRMRRLSAAGTGRAASAGVEADLQSLFFAMLDGRVTDALPTATAMHARAQDSADVVTRGLGCLALGRCLLLAGQVERARVILLDAVADFRQVDLSSSLAWALALLSQAAALTGRLEDARRRYAEAGSGRHHVGTARLEIDLVGARVWLAVAEGDRSGALALALDGAEHYPGLPLTRAWLLHLACRVGDRRAAVPASLREIAASVECDGPALLADHAEALHEGDGRALEAVAERFSARGMLPVAAEAALEAARAHHAAGSTDGARRASARAATLIERIDAISTPSLEDPMEPALLSRREQDVARMAAAGRTNAEIAEHLVVSVRTVESHLYQVYAKLGARSRTELHRYLPGGRSGTDQ